MGKSQKQESQQKEILRLSSLAESGQAEAQNVLAARLAQGYGVKTDIAGALYWYAQAVALGYTHAKWNAGTMLLAGEGLPAPRRDVGMLMIDQAARSGEPSACRFLAQCFAEGRFGKEVDTELSDHFQARSHDHLHFDDYGDPILIQDFGIMLTKPRV